MTTSPDPMAVERASSGFLLDTLLSPPPSSVTSSLATDVLPQPRTRPLRGGSTKETAFIQYVDHAVLEVTRKYAKKFAGGQSEGDIKGYESFKEVGKDLERLTDVIWVSGTPSLQIPYLLSLALLVTNYLPSFPPSPRMTFRLLHKLDLAFSSLLQGRDADSGDMLPGFETCKGLNTTQKVRIKSLVERTRVLVVELMASLEPMEEDESDDDGSASEEEGMQTSDLEPVGRWEMEVAKVYDRTLVELGDVLGGDSS